jgi:hypothetical protein
MPIQPNFGSATLARGKVRLNGQLVGFNFEAAGSSAGVPSAVRLQVTVTQPETGAVAQADEIVPSLDFSVVATRVPGSANFVRGKKVLAAGVAIVQWVKELPLN